MDDTLQWVNQNTILEGGSFCKKFRRYVCTFDTCTKIQPLEKNMTMKNLNILFKRLFH